MRVPKSYKPEADALSFVEGSREKVKLILMDELIDLKSLKFQLGLKGQLRKDNLIGAASIQIPFCRTAWCLFYQPMRDM